MQMFKLSSKSMVTMQQSQRSSLSSEDSMSMLTKRLLMMSLLSLSDHLLFHQAVLTLELPHHLASNLNTPHWDTKKKRNLSEGLLQEILVHRLLQALVHHHQEAVSWESLTPVMLLEVLIFLFQEVNMEGKVISDHLHLNQVKLLQEASLRNLLLRSLLGALQEAVFTHHQ